MGDGSGPETIPKLTATMHACESISPEGDEDFTVVVRLTGEGRVSDSVVSPSMQLSECFREKISRTPFPKPLWDGHWLEIKMHRRLD